MKRLHILLVLIVTCRIVQAQTIFTYDASGNRLAKVVAGQAANATLSGSQTITTGQPASLTVALSGMAPWSLTLTGGSSPITFAGITSSPFLCTVTPGVNTTYVVGSVRNSCGAGTVGGTAFVTVTSNSCTSMYTLKNGSWDDVSVWSCNRVPVSADPVTVNHAVTVPANYLGNALRLTYGLGARLIYSVGGRLRLGP